MNEVIPPFQIQKLMQLLLTSLNEWKSLVAEKASLNCNLMIQMRFNWCVYKTRTRHTLHLLDQSVGLHSIVFSRHMSRSHCNHIGKVKRYEMELYDETKSYEWMNEMKVTYIWHEVVRNRDNDEQRPVRSPNLTWLTLEWGWRRVKTNNQLTELIHGILINLSLLLCLIW